jgi:hypothetical protein
VIADWPEFGSADIPPSPMSESELQTKYKMDHFVVNLIDCRKFVLRYLCQENKINLIPVALQCTQEEQLVNSGAFKKFLVGDTYYKVNVAEYGRRSKQTSTVPIRNAQIIGDSGKYYIQRSQRY